MEIRSIFPMDKLMQNEKGFTLVEMLVTISILLLIMAISPFLKPSRQLVFTCETEKLHSFLLQAQMKAMFTKKSMYIQFQTDGVQAGEEFFVYDNMYCEGKAFHYTKQGTISQAQTITCSLQNKKKTIVLQLGSGAIDVR